MLLADAVVGGDLAAGGFVRRRAPRLPYFADDLEATRDSIALVARLARGPVHLGHRGPLRAEDLARLAGSSWAQGAGRA